MSWVVAQENPAIKPMMSRGGIQALLLKVRENGWRVVGATTWKSIRKFRARGPSPGEERNVLGLVEAAVRVDADAVAFIRDSDGDDERIKTIEAAVAKGGELFPGIDIIGGAAIPVLEGWLLAVCGVRGTQKMSKSKALEQLKARGLPSKDTAAMVGKVEEMDPEKIPEDAVSLRCWLASAREAFSR